MDAPMRELMKQEGREAALAASKTQSFQPSVTLDDDDNDIESANHKSDNEEEQDGDVEHSDDASGGHGGGHGATTKPGSATVYATLFNCLTSYLGSGILAMPFAMKESGVWAGVITLVVVAWLSHYCIVLLLKCKYEVQKIQAERGGRQHAVTYGRIARHVYGVAGVTVVDSALIFTQLGVCIIYLIFIGRNLESLTSFEHREIIIIVSMGLALMCMLRSIRYLTPFAVIAQINLLLGLFLIMYYAFPDAQGHWQTGSLEVFHSTNFALFFGIAVYTFEGIGLALPIESSMRDPTRYQLVLDVTYIAVTLLFVFFGVVTYAGFSDATEAAITLNLPHDTLSAIIKVGLAVCLFFTFPLMMVPPIEILERPLLASRLGRRLAPALVQACARTLLVFVTAFIAVVAPNFGHVMGIIGSAGSTMLAFILPALFYRAIFRARLSRCDQLGLFAIAAFGLIGGLAGVITAMFGLGGEN